MRQKISRIGDVSQLAGAMDSDDFFIMSHSHNLSQQARRKLDLLVNSDAKVRNQSQLARLTGISQSAISEMISGKRSLYADQVWSIAKALGVSLDWLLDDQKEKPPAPELSEDERRLVWYIRRVGISPDAVADLIPVSVQSGPEQPGEFPPAGAGGVVSRIEDFRELDRQRPAGRPHRKDKPKRPG